MLAALLISITGGDDLTLYDVDEAASRIRQEVDEEANIIVGATFEPALDEAVRVSVVATGIDQAANFQIEQMSAQSQAEQVPHSSLVAPPLVLTARTAPNAVQAHPPVAAVTGVETQPLLAPVIPFPERTEGRKVPEEETHLIPSAIRRRSLLENSASAVSESDAQRASGWR